MLFYNDLSGLDPQRFPESDDSWAGSYISVKAMPDGRAWCLMSLSLGRLRIVIGEDQFTCGEHWCYEDNVKAVASYVAGPEVTPTGWSRHMLPDYTFEYPEDP
jgi:hypothetical protein